MMSYPYNMTSEPFNTTSHPYNMTSETFNMTSHQYNMTSEPYNMTSSPYNVTPSTTINPLQRDLQPVFKDVSILFYVAVIVVALLGNGSVLYLVGTQRAMRHVTNYFIASLAASDACMAVVCIPSTLVTNVLLDSWPFPAWMCPFTTYLQVVLVFQSAYTLMAISLERYVTIMFPFRRRLTHRQCLLVILLTWLLSMVTPLPTAVLARLQEFPTHQVNVSEIRCYELWPEEQQAVTYGMTLMVLQYFAPLTVLLFTYARIVVVVWIKEAPPHGQMGSGHAAGMSGRPVLQHQDSCVETGHYGDPRKRIIKMMMAVVGMYAVCWLPIHLMSILGDAYRDMWTQRAMRYMWVGAHWLAMSSCMYNPLIYCWMSPKFRQGYRLIITQMQHACGRGDPFHGPHSLGTASSFFQPPRGGGRTHREGNNSEVVPLKDGPASECDRTGKGVDWHRQNGRIVSADLTNTSVLDTNHLDSRQDSSRV